MFLLHPASHVAMQTCLCAHDPAGADEQEDSVEIDRTSTAKRRCMRKKKMPAKQHEDATEIEGELDQVCQPGTRADALVCVQQEASYQPVPQVPPAVRMKRQLPAHVPFKDRRPCAASVRAALTPVLSCSTLL